MSDEEQVVTFLNNALTTPDASEKLLNFHKIQEFILRKTPNLLPKYLPNILNFTVERSADIKKALVGFIEELCKVRESLIPKVMVNLHMLLCDESVQVQKRVIQAAISIYRRTLSWLCKASNITDEMEAAWKQLNTIKLEIANMIDSDNDGIRTSSVKFLECVILLQTYPDETDNKRANDFSLDDVPLTLKIARRRKLEEEASNLFELLVKFHGSPHISSANLLACIGVLTNIAKSRAAFMIRVIPAIESLYNNLPPTLTTTQVSSVKKKLKTELCGLIKHPAAYDFVSKITPLLLELGCTQSEVTKMIPKADERRKYNKRLLSVESSVQQLAKRPRLDKPPDLADHDSNDSQPTQAAAAMPAAPPPTPLEANERFILDNLTIEKAIYLIFTHIPKLPPSMPKCFVNDYPKYVGSGRIGREHLAKVLAAQFVEAKVGPGARIVVEEEKAPEPAERKKREREPDEAKDEEKVVKKERKVAKIKTLKLNEITKPLLKDVKEVLLVSTVKRLLSQQKTRSRQVHQKIVTTLASNFSSVVREAVLTYLLSDLRSNVDTALAWLFDEYSIMQGFIRIPPLRKGARPDDCYNILLCSFIQSSCQDAIILSRLLLEAPLITDDALDEIKPVCRDEKRAGWALGLLRDLTVRKPPKQLTFLNTLLSYTTYESNVVRDHAISHVLELHKRFELRMIIEAFAKMNMEFLKLTKPPESLCGVNQGRVKSEHWNDNFIKACLLPYVSLLPANESLIHDLAKVYSDTNPDIKRVILRLVEGPIKAMGMESPNLLKLVEDCPAGAETFVTRVIHILTDKRAPSDLLVQRVKELYNTRVSDVRFLIPVLTGLTKQEIISALPKLIKLNPVVVREVFNRLLGIHGAESPISASELLVALHLLDSHKVDLKTTIKAISLCMQEKRVYSQEVLAVVLQQLMDQTPLPTLMMRTVIQALGTYPRLSGFVMNILQRLIVKQVWKHKLAWEGFIKCCQKTRPQSFAVLMQLPAPQLQEVLNVCHELREPLKDHLMTFTEAQRAHIPAAVQEIIMGTFAAPAPQPVMPPVVPMMPIGVDSVPLPVPPPSVMPPMPVMPPMVPSEPLPPGMD